MEVVLSESLMLNCWLIARGRRGTIPEDVLPEYSLSLDCEPPNFHGKALNAARKTVDRAADKFRDPEILAFWRRPFAAECG